MDVLELPQAEPRVSRGDALLADGERGNPRREVALGNLRVSDAWADLGASSHGILKGAITRIRLQVAVRA